MLKACKFHLSVVNLRSLLIRVVIKQGVVDWSAQSIIVNQRKFCSLHLKNTTITLLFSTKRRQTVSWRLLPLELYQEWIRMTLALASRRDLGACGSIPEKRPPVLLKNLRSTSLYAFSFSGSTLIHLHPQCCQSQALALSQIPQISCI